MVHCFHLLAKWVFFSYFWYVWNVLIDGMKAEPSLASLFVLAYLYTFCHLCRNQSFPCWDRTSLQAIPHALHPSMLMNDWFSKVRSLIATISSANSVPLTHSKSPPASPWHQFQLPAPCLWSAVALRQAHSFEALIACEAVIMRSALE